MKSEARANLIFLGVFLVLTLPGAFILVRKKMDPTVRPMWLPDAVSHHMVYIDPTDAPESIPRMVPALTAAWVNDLARSRFGPGTVVPTAAPDDADTPTTRPAQPVMSDQRLAQLAGLGPGPEGTGIRFAVLVWNVPRGDGPVGIELSAWSGANEIPIFRRQVEVLAIPDTVKRDIQQSGYPSPPQRAAWVTGELPAGGDVELRLACTVDGLTISDTLRLPR